MKRSTKNILKVVGVLGAGVLGVRWLAKRHVDKNGGVMDVAGPQPMGWVKLCDAGPTPGMTLSYSTAVGEQQVLLRKKIYDTQWCPPVVMPSQQTATATLHAITPPPLHRG